MVAGRISICLPPIGTVMVADHLVPKSKPLAKAPVTAGVENK